MNLLANYLLKAVAEIKFATQLSVLMTPVILMTELKGWMETNYIYVSWVLVAILVDWIFGMWKHLKFRTFSLKLNGLGLLIKISLCLGAGLLFEGFNHLTADSEFIVSTLKLVFRSIVFIYPTLSAFKSMHTVSNGKMPPSSIVNLFSKFNENLDLNTFNAQKNEKTDSPDK